MSRINRNNISDLFAGGEVDVFVREGATTGRHSVKQRNASKPKSSNKPTMATNKERFESKLENEEFSDFDHKDWFQYFTYKASTKGIKYIGRNYAKEYAILKSIMNELSWVDIKNMIDFVFDSDQDIVDKRTMGVWILSKGWINTTYQSTQLWLAGEYKPKSAPLHNREWKAEASRKDSGTGLTYGRPIRSNEETSKPKLTRKTGRKFGL